MTVEIEAWTNGTPVTVQSFPVETQDAGMAALWRIGHSRDYSSNHAGYLMDGGTIVAILDIYGDGRFNVRTIAKGE